MEIKLHICKCGHEQSLHGVNGVPEKKENDTSCCYCLCKKFEEKK